MTAGQYDLAGPSLMLADQLVVILSTSAGMVQDGYDVDFILAW